MTTPQFAMPRDMSRYSDLEAELLQAIQAAGLREPIAELHFDWCCEHPERDHDGEAAPMCHGCLNDDLDEAPGPWRAATLFHAFHRGRDWRFDFAYPALKVAIECEGGTWSEGRHTRGQGFEDDCRKYNTAVLQEWRVLRFTGGQIESGEAVEVIERALRSES